MHIEYKDKDVEKICTDFSVAKKYYPLKIAKKIIKAINFIENADSLMDVIQYQPFYFHGLEGDRKDQYSIDVDGRKSSYRIILKPKEDVGDDIIAVAKSVKIIFIWEVSKHYE